MTPKENSTSKIVPKVISILLWALTAYLAGYQIFLIRSIVASAYLRLLENFDVPINVLERLSATGIGNIASLLMAVLAIVIIVGGFDYHWSHGGEPRSFKILALTLVFQLSIQLLYVLLYR
jgi:small-conductance mechanosensitive channel